MRYLLDTCVICEPLSKRPSQAIVDWLSAIEEQHCFLSSVTIGEIRKGIARLPASRRRQRLHEFLTDDLRLRFADRILPLDAATMLTWGDLMAGLARKGVTPPIIDSLIAATALHHRCVVVTRNVADFAATGVTTLDPWSAVNWTG